MIIKKQDMRKVGIYISREDYKKFQIILITQGTNASAWFRKQVAKKIKEAEKKHQFSP